jgi:PIN domain nuclease of toxin-antitoxin system
VALAALLDTHVWLWWLLGDERLSPSERRALDSMAAAQSLAISAISLWEVQMLTAKGRLQLNRPFSTWLKAAASPDVVNVLELDIEVVTVLDDLPESFHGDPADRVIVATARAHRLPLATHDVRIRRSRLAKLWVPDGRGG